MPRILVVDDCYDTVLVVTNTFGYAGHGLQGNPR